jgi:hypothetical protein
LKKFEYIKKIAKQIEGQWAESARGLPTQCWHGPACASHVVHNCSSVAVLDSDGEATAAVVLTSAVLNGVKVRMG